MVPTAYFYAEEDGLAELIEIFGKFKPLEKKTLLASVRTLKENHK